MHASADDAAGDVSIGDAHTRSAHSLRSVQRLLWDVLSERLREAERDEVKRAVGFLLVEENQALFNEAVALADILGDVQTNTSTLLRHRALCSNPERNLVEADILIAMDKLRAMVTAAMFATSAAKDRNPEEVLRASVDTHDRTVYEYIQTSMALQAAANPGILTGGSALQRPGTASSRPATASTLSRPSTASSTGSAVASLVLDSQQLLACVQGKLSVFGIDDVKEAVQCALREERAALLNDIEYLTALVTDEADMQVKVAAPPPSMQELKRYGKKLKSMVEAESSRLQHEQVVSRMFSAAQAEPGKAGKLRRMVGAARIVPAASALPHPASRDSSRPDAAAALGSARPQSSVASAGSALAAVTNSCQGKGVPGDSSPDSLQDVHMLSSSASGSVIELDHPAPQGPGLAGQAPAKASAAGAGLVPPVLQRTGSSRRQLIQALRAFSPSLGAAQAGGVGAATTPPVLPSLTDAMKPLSNAMLLDPPGPAADHTASKVQNVLVLSPAPSATPLPAPSAVGAAAWQAAPSPHHAQRLQGRGTSSPVAGGPALLQPLPGSRRVDSDKQPPAQHQHASVAHTSLSGRCSGVDAEVGSRQHCSPAAAAGLPRPAAGPAGMGHGGLSIMSSGQSSAASIGPAAPSAARGPRGGKLDPGTLLDAQAETLKGGVSAILAKHGYRPASAGGGATRTSAGSSSANNGGGGDMFDQSWDTPPR